MSSELQKAQELLQESTDGVSVVGDEDLDSYVRSLLETNMCATIGIKLEFDKVYLTVVYPTHTELICFDHFTEEDYNDFCKNTLNIDPNEKYNCSRTINVSGTRTRVYAVMPPFVRTPNITISTTKIPPKTLEKQTIPNELWDKIVHSNFIVAGASGSGKTYLTNWLLSNFIKEEERVAIIEEFGELIPPNDLTTSIIVPPPKPNEPHLLKFVTEQSNLMRLDAIYVGEIKGGEAWPFVVNLASGTRGGCTVHGENARQALERLKALCRLSCDNDDAIDDFIAKSIKYIIVMRNKRIFEIQELNGVHHKGTFTMKEVAS